MRNSFCIMLLLTLFSACGNDVISDESPASYFNIPYYDDEDNCTIDGLSDEAKKIENLQLVIPGYIKGKQVTKVNIHCDNLVDINIPDSVKYLDLSDCKSLLIVELPDGIKDVRLRDCKNLVDINIPDSVEYLDLSGCKSLLIVELPDGIKTVKLCDSYIFPQNGLPDSIEQLDLSNNNAIGDISIPESMESFEIDFNSFDLLWSVHIPLTLETLKAPYDHSSSETLMGTIREINLDFEQTDIPLKLGRNVFPEYREFKDGTAKGCRFSLNISRPIEAECESCKISKECVLYRRTTRPRTVNVFFPIYEEKIIPLCRRCAILNQK